MAKKIVGFIKLQVPAGKANPSPPIGPALGQRGLNIMEFCKAFNAQTQGMEPGLPIPVVITAFADKSFTFIMKTPPASILIKKAAKIDKGSAKRAAGHGRARPLLRPQSGRALSGSAGFGRARAGCRQNTAALSAKHASRLALHLDRRSRMAGSRRQTLACARRPAR